MNSKFGQIGAVWGVVGVIALLLFAVVRLTPIAQEALDLAAHPLHWMGFAASLVFFAYTEGYRAFQKQFSPRVVARAFTLLDNPRPLRVIFAPLFAMGYFGATRKRMIVSWCLTAGIIVLIRLVGALEQPWRGIIDFGVVIALLWGVGSIVAFAYLAVSGQQPDIAPDVPEAKAA